MVVDPFVEGLGGITTVYTWLDVARSFFLRTWLLHQSEGTRSENWLRSGAIYWVSALSLLVIDLICWHKPSRIFGSGHLYFPQGLWGLLTIPINCACEFPLVATPILPVS